MLLKVITGQGWGVVMLLCGRLGSVIPGVHAMDGGAQPGA